jgi:hypothetical protein
MSNLGREQRRSLAARLARVVWRSLRILLVAFAAMGPAPPPPPQFRPAPTEQHEAKERSPKEL